MLVQLDGRFAVARRGETLIIFVVRSHFQTRCQPHRRTQAEAVMEKRPTEDQSVDAVVTTWTMCSSSLQEMRRVLNPLARGRSFQFSQIPASPHGRAEPWVETPRITLIPVK
jgi:hypothetical protein